MLLVCTNNTMTKANSAVQFDVKDVPGVVAVAFQFSDPKKAAVYEIDGEYEISITKKPTDHGEKQ